MKYLTCKNSREEVVDDEEPLVERDTAEEIDEELEAVERNGSKGEEQFDQESDVIELNLNDLSFSLSLMRIKSYA